MKGILRFALAASILLTVSCGGGRIVHVEADPQKGFFWPYLVYLPEAAQASIHSIVVAPNNTGFTTDDFSRHEAGARTYLKMLAGRLKELGAPILMPVFPRWSEKMGGWMVYTQALDRDALVGQNTLGNAVAVTLHWQGERLSTGNTMFYRLDDILVIQDGMPYRCIASDFDPTKVFVDVSQFDVTFIMRGGWDLSRPFNVIEALDDGGGFTFTGITVNGGGQITSCTAADGRFTISRIAPCTDRDFKSLWSPGGKAVESSAPIERLDLQLLAMIEDAGSRFDFSDFEGKPAYYGFSASGQFVNRFALLHRSRMTTGMRKRTGASPTRCSAPRRKIWQGSSMSARNT